MYCLVFLTDLFSFTFPNLDHLMLFWEHFFFNCRLVHVFIRLAHVFSRLMHVHVYA